MKWKLAGCVILLACLILQAALALAAGGTTTVSGTVPLVTYEVSASNIGYYSATISWKTNGNATSQVFYDTVYHDNITGYAYHTTENTSLVSVHSLTLTGLSPATTYHYRAKSVLISDGTEFIAISDDYTFTTLSPPVVEVSPPAPPPPPAPVVVAPGIVDISKIVTTEGVFTQSVSAKSEDAKVELTIPKDTVGKTKEGTPLTKLTVIPMTTPPAPPADSHTIGLVYDFGPDGATFEPPVTLTISYDPSLLPAGVNEENLVIAYYDEDAGKWIELDSVVDTEAKTISAKVSHFTTFAVFGFPPVVPPVIPVVPPVTPVPPAAFTVSHLSVSPSEVHIGERVTIRVIVTNIGGQSGSYGVTLKINGVVEATKEVTVNAGLSKEVTFTTTRDIPGTYLVDVDGLTGSFVVKEKPAPAAFSVTNLSIQPTQVQPKEVVTITMLVSNTGGTEGSYTAVLKINGVKEAEKSIALGAGESQEASFSVTREKAGSYTVTADGLSGSFTVTEVPPVKPPVNWPLIGGIIAAAVVVGLAGFFWMRRKAK